MAYFAEIDSNRSKTLKVVAACPNDIAAHGGDQSEEAAEHFKTVSPLSAGWSSNWVQTSSTFRG